MGKIFTTVLVTIFVGVAVVGILVTINTLQDPFGSDCDTILCCQNCDSVPVERIVDGDTFRSEGGRVRLYGVDTPEVGEPCADEATERLEKLARDEVLVEAGPRDLDQFGRKLYYIYTTRGESIDEILVQEGLAVAWTRDGQHMDILIGLERGAREKGVGCLWQ